jgi:hypothetical protein
LQPAFNGSFVGVCWVWFCCMVHLIECLLMSGDIVRF